MKHVLLILALLAAPLGAAEPPQLAEARAAYDKAVARAIAPLRDKYLAELDKLQKSLTTQGKLEEALAVRQARVAALFAGEYEGLIPANKHRWRNTFREDGTCVAIVTGQPPILGAWTLTGDDVTIKWDNGTWSKVSLANLADAEVSGLGGTSGRGEKTTDEIVLTKKR